MTADFERQLASLHPGAHVCSIGESAAEQLAAAIPFLADGLARGERCLYLAGDSALAEVAHLLTEAGVDVAAACRRDALRLLNPGALGTQSPTSFAREAEAQALAAGFAGTRLAVAWGDLEPDQDHGRLETEAELNRFTRSIILCQYDRSASELARLHDALCTHPLAILNGRLCANPYCDPPALAFDPERPHLSAAFRAKQVDWWLLQLQRLQETDEQRLRLERALRTREETVRVQLAELEQIYRHAPVGLSFVNRDLRIVRCNEQLAVIAHKPIHEIIGRTVGEVNEEVAPELRDADEQRFRQVISSSEPLLNFEVSGVLAAEPNVQRHWLINYCPLRGDDGTVLGVMAATVEITEHKRAQEELQRQKELLQTIFDHLPVMVAQVDTAARIRLVNRHWEEVLGWSLAEMAQRDMVAELLAEPRERDRAFGLLRQAPSGWWDFRLRVRDGRVLDTSWALGCLSDGTRIAIGRDDTERKRADARLRDYFERVQALSHRLLTVQEDERRHLARELHDEIGQSLTGLQFVLENGSDLAASPAPAKLLEARNTVDGLLAKVRLLSFDLRPAILDHLGLLPALVWLFERYTAQTQVRVHFRHEALNARFGPTTETAAYRLIQESLTNAARHAGVHEVAVRVWSQGGFLNLQIEDEGRGFNPETVFASGATSGLTGMQERVQLLSGQLVVDSSPGAGTQLMMRLPVAN